MKLHSPLAATEGKAKQGENCCSISAGLPHHPTKLKLLTSLCYPRIPYCHCSQQAMSFEAKSQGLRTRGLSGLLCLQLCVTWHSSESRDTGYDSTRTVQWVVRQKGRGVDTGDPTAIRQSIANGNPQLDKTILEVTKIEINSTWQT